MNGEFVFFIDFVGDVDCIIVFIDNVVGDR